MIEVISNTPSVSSQFPQMFPQAGKDAVLQYSLRWQKLRRPKTEGSTRTLSFQDVPWPVLQTPSRPADITEEQLAKFFLDPAINGRVDRQSRITALRLELRNWHPDKFITNVLPLVYEDQLPLVEEGMQLVSRILTQMLKEFTTAIDPTI
jgi:hypothetical protein